MVSRCHRFTPVQPCLVLHFNCDEKLAQVAAHPQVKMFEIKLAQGAKPGKGGILPGAKVDAEVARIRGIPEGEDSISPNRHAEVDDFGDLLDLTMLDTRLEGRDEQLTIPADPARNDEDRHLISAEQMDFLLDSLSASTSQCVLVRGLGSSSVFWRSLPRSDSSASDS